MKTPSKNSLLGKQALALVMSGDGSFFTSRTFILSTALVLGSGAALIAYQQYMWSRRQKSLTAQIVQLKQQILKLENDIKLIKEATGTSSSTEDMEEVFVDASDVAQEVTNIREFGDSDASSTECAAASTTADRLANILTKLDQQTEQGGFENLKNAHAALTELANKNPENAAVQWRLARSAFLLASEEMFSHPDKPQEGQKNLMQAAHEAALAAVRLDSENGDAHKWLAIIIGSITQFLPVQEQIKNAFDIKEHIQAAIKYKPSDALSHHMLGRWCYSVYMLSWVERKVASTLFAVPPTATLEEALDCFHKAEELKPKGSIDNALYLAKAYLAQQDYKTAVSWLRVGSSIYCSSPDDMKSQNEIQSLLSEYESYSNG
ncbi:hypothetical protein BsWGS_09907 [Bradybaena similaris]